MAQYLQDRQIRSLAVNAAALGAIEHFVRDRVLLWNGQPTVHADPEQTLLVTYTVRVDGRGFRTDNFEDVLQSFNTSRQVERIIFDVQSPRSLKTNQNAGPFFRIPLDRDDRGSVMAVAGENRDWVEATFGGIQGLLEQRKSFSRFLMTAYTGMLLQVSGVLLGVLVCLWAATHFAPYLKNVEYPKLAVFALSFLVFSNLWTYLFQRLTAGLFRVFPNVRFDRPETERLPMLIRVLVEAGIAALFVWWLSIFMQWALGILSPFLTP